MRGTSGGQDVGQTPTVMLHATTLGLVSSSRRMVIKVETREDSGSVLSFMSVLRQDDVSIYSIDADDGKIC